MPITVSQAEEITPSKKQNLTQDFYPFVEPFKNEDQVVKTESFRSADNLNDFSSNDCAVTITIDEDDDDDDIICEDADSYAEFSSQEYLAGPYPVGSAFGFEKDPALKKINELKLIAPELAFVKKSKEHCLLASVMYCFGRDLAGEYFSISKEDTQSKSEFFNNKFSEFIVQFPRLTGFKAKIKRSANHIVGAKSYLKNIASKGYYKCLKKNDQQASETQRQGHSEEGIDYQTMNLGQDYRQEIYSDVYSA
jgi:hypothetical protein